jgi:hypothetical protein
MPLSAAMLAAEAERRRQERRAHPAYRDRWLGWRHLRLESYARRLLREAQDGRWLRFYATDADSAAMTDQILRYIVRQECPAQSVRVEWLRWDDSWADHFPRRPVDRYRLSGRGPFPVAELARMAREQSADGEWWYTGRLRLGPKRGTIPPPAFPRPRRSMSEVLGRALAGEES